MIKDLETSMHFRLSAAFALLVSLACLTSCSGGSDSAAGATISTCTGAETNALCLEACSLGCGSGISCDVSEIAQNEIEMGSGQT